MIKQRRSSRLAAIVGLAAFTVLFAGAYPGGEVAGSPLSIATAPSLGSAASFAVLGGSTVTNTGPTVITGDLGVSPGTAITGFPPGVVNGETHAADAVALQAQNDVSTAYNDLAGQPSDTDLTGQDLGGLTLVPGVYTFSSSAQLTGQLTLNAEGDPDAVWVFQIGSTLTTASNSSVLMIGGSICNVFWQVGSSATLGTGTSFVGNILALTSITLNTGATVDGRALARNGAVTMDTNTVDASLCTSTSTPVTPTSTPSPSSSTEEPRSASGNISVEKIICGSIDGSSCVNPDTSLAGYKIDFRVYAGSHATEPDSGAVQPIAVTLGEGGTGFDGSRGLTEGWDLPPGDYTVCEVPRAYRDGTEAEALVGGACQQVSVTEDQTAALLFLNTLPASTAPAVVPTAVATAVPTPTPTAVPTTMPTAMPVSPAAVPTPAPAAAPTSVPVTPEVAAGPASALPATPAGRPAQLPKTGDPSGIAYGTAMGWLALAGAAATLFGSVLLRRRR